VDTSLENRRQKTVTPSNTPIVLRVQIPASTTQLFTSNNRNKQRHGNLLAINLFLAGGLIRLYHCRRRKAADAMARVS
jgi:hypothetical protein